MRRLRSVREEESITSGPGSFAHTSYALRAPDRMRYSSDNGTAALTIGRREWLYVPGTGWRRRKDPSPLAFRTRSWFRWTTMGHSARRLEPRPHGARRVLELALFDPGTPAWYRLAVDRGTHRVLRVRMIADAHFMRQRFHAFNRPTEIRPPR